jgi:tetraacyldisaccharide 4'-kinase
MFKLRYPNFWQNKHSLLSILLLPFSYLYSLASYIRSLLAVPISLNTKVICVGNISVGGTGKTQAVLHLAKLLTKNNKKICIVTKGYGRKTKDTKLLDLNYDNITETGDEAFMLAQYFPVIVFNNFYALDELIQHHQFEVAIFDDGMQNPNFHKDLTIMMIDGLRGFGNNKIFPAGPLREHVYNIDKKANLAIIVGEDKYHAQKQLDILILNASITPESELDKDICYVAFAAIGNPDKFFLTLEEMGLSIVKKVYFPDHYNYLPDNVFTLLAISNKYNATLITTEKDWVKLDKDLQTKIKHLKVTLNIKDEQKLVGLLNEKLFKDSPLPY